MLNQQKTANIIAHPCVKQTAKAVILSKRHDKKKKTG